MGHKHKTVLNIVLGVATAIALFTANAEAQDGKPNILVIWGDDIGTWNISHNNRGMMGYKRPTSTASRKKAFQLHRLLRPTSCTAGRAAFINGSVPVRTGMTKVGMPGAEQGWQKTDVTWPQ
jgi:arylsulfatase A-like enzyme